MHRIIPRSEWGARYPAGFRDATLPVDELWLHHSVTIAPDLVAPFDDDYAAVRRLEEIGHQRFGGGMSYTFPITPVGLVFEGHGVGRSGAHTLGRNHIARSFVFVGNYQDHPVTREQKVSAAWLLVHGRRQGWWTEARLSGGHRDAPGQDPTACPGDQAETAIDEINALAADYEAGRIDLDNPTRRTPIGDEYMLVKKLTGDDGVGTVALVSGGILSAMDTAWAEQTNEKAGGGLMAGVSEAVWDDLVRKSQGQEAVPHLLSEVLTATQDNTSLLREVLTALKARA